MKKILLLLLALALSVSAFAGCDREEPSDSSSAPPSESSFAPDESSSSSNDPSLPEPSAQAPNETKVEVKQTKKYYRQISSGYSMITSRSTGTVFFDGIFEMNRQSQYKILSSYSELQAFSLLNYDEVEASLFEESRIVAILHYRRGPSGDAKTPAGLYDIKLDGINGLQITMDLFYTSLLTTEDVVDVYSLYFAVVPKSEIEQIAQNGNITVKAELLEQYNLNPYKIEGATDKTEAYYVPSSEAMKKLELYDAISTLLLLSPPCLVIHLEEAIETDFIVNSFKYENGEMYITIQIFDKEEMKEYYELPSNLVVVSLQPHRGDLEIAVPNNMPADSPINITLEYVS